MSRIVLAESIPNKNGTRIQFVRYKVSAVGYMYELSVVNSTGQIITTGQLGIYVELPIDGSNETSKVYRPLNNESQLRRVVSAYSTGQYSLTTRTRKG